MASLASDPSDERVSQILSIFWTPFSPEASRFLWLLSICWIFWESMELVEPEGAWPPESIQILCRQVSMASIALRMSIFQFPNKLIESVVGEGAELLWAPLGA